MQDPNEYIMDIFHLHKIPNQTKLIWGAGCQSSDDLWRRPFLEGDETASKIPAILFLDSDANYIVVFNL